MRSLLVTVLLIAEPVAAQTMPKLRAGLWEQTTRMPTLPAPYDNTVSRLCVNDAVQDRWSVIAGQPTPGMSCGKPSLAKIAGGWRFSHSCKVQGRTMTTTGTVTGDFQSSYAMTSTTSGLPGGAGSIAASARYLGACKGLKPGQMSAMGQIIDMTGGR